MTTPLPYSTEYDPPCPVLAVRVAAPSGGVGVGLVAVVDTGADVTLVPASTALVLGLPVVSSIRVAGVTGAVETADVHAALIELAGVRMLTEVVALGEGAIVGRDLLNRFVVRLDGPGRQLKAGLARPARRRPVKR